MKSVEQDWIGRRATAWQSCRPKMPLDHSEQAAVERIVGGATLIGLGEMTHGSKEVLQARARLLTHLVGQCGVRMLVLETGVAATLPLDNYVVSGKGTAREALAATEYWSTVNLETLELIEWLREYNRTSAEDGAQVRIWGCDVQSIDQAKAELNRRISAFGRNGLLPAADCDAATRALTSLPCDRDLYRHVEALLSAASAHRPDKDDVKALQLRRATSMANVAESTARVTRLLRILLQRLNDASDGEESFAFERCTRLLEQAVAFYSPNGESDRDPLMAENVIAVRSHFRGRRIALLAHNLHVMRSSLSIRGHRFESLGCRLGQQLNDDYKVIGSAFHHGAYIASAGQSSHEVGIAQALVPRSNSWEHYFQEYCAGTAAPGALLAFDSESKKHSPAWSAELHMRLGEAGNQGAYEESFIRQAPPDQYDGLLFVSESTEISILSEYYAVTGAKWHAKSHQTP